MFNENCLVPKVEITEVKMNEHYKVEFKMADQIQKIMKIWTEFVKWAPDTKRLIFKPGELFGKGSPVWIKPTIF